MKKIFILLAALCVATTAVAEFPAVRNDGGSTTLIPSDGGFGPLAVDSNGRLFTAAASGSGDVSSAMSIAPLAVGTDTAETDSTTTVILATSHAARVNDYVKFTGGTAANINVWRRVSAVATNSITVASAFPSAPANTDPFTIYRPVPNSTTYAEDSAHTTADLGQFILTVRNANLATAAAEADYQYLATGTHGNAIISVVSDGNISNGVALMVGEDTPFAAGNSGAKVFAQRDDAISVDTSTDGDVGPFKMDKFNRLLATEINQEHLFSCVSASDITDTNSTAVCAADADEIYVIKDICCSNTDTAVATRVNILDGATVVHTMVLGSMVAAAPGDSNHCQTFPTGIKGAAINTAINAQAITTSAEIRCSIHGYKVPS